MTDFQTLPRGGLDRLILGFFSLVSIALFGFCTLAVFLSPFPPLGLLNQLILFATTELLLTTTVFFSLLLAWAVAMPKWIERIFEAVWNKLFLVIVLSTLPIVALLILACFDLRIGDGL